MITSKSGRFIDQASGNLENRLWLLDHLPGVSQPSKPSGIDLPSVVGLDIQHRERVEFSERFVIEVIPAVDVVVRFKSAEFLVETVVLGFKNKGFLRIGDNFQPSTNHQQIHISSLQSAGESTSKLKFGGVAFIQLSHRGKRKNVEQKKGDACF